MDLSNITNIPQIKNATLARLCAEADTIQAFLSTPASLEDPSSLTHRLNTMDAYLARLSDMLTLAKSLKEYATGVFLSENEDRLSKLTATISNRMIKTALYEFNITADRLDTMYSTADHLARDLQTQVSYIKQQMTMR